MGVSGSDFRFNLESFFVVVVLWERLVYVEGQEAGALETQGP